MASRADITASERSQCGGMLPAWLALLLLWSPVVLASSLSHYVRHHEMLHYAPVAESAAERGRRSTDRPLQLSLRAAGRQLSLQLVPDTVTLAPDVSYSGPSGAAVGAAALPPIYTGWVRGEPDSQLFGALIDGVFDGTIVLQNETLVVESTALHADGGPNGHSFVYRASDMVMPPRPDGDRPCGVGDGFRFPDDATAVLSGGRGSDPWHTMETLASTLKQQHDAGKSRAKRHRDQDGFDEDLASEEEYDEHEGGNARTLCSVYVETDPVLWKHVFKRTYGSVRHTEIILQWMAASHVQGVSRVFKKATFDGMHHHHGYQFRIQKLVVTEDVSCLPNFAGRPNRLCFEHVGSQAYLEAHSTSNFDDFCLAFAISHHDFEGGTIGLAWIGAPWEGAGRGVCARHAQQAFRNWETGVVERKSRSLNTAMITLLNYGDAVHPLQSQLTLAHEIGHTMGSPHDQGAPGSACLPTDGGGKFIMYFLAQDGHLARHHKFSNCSVGNISRVLDFIKEGRYFNCFVEKQAPFCGNSVLEGEEQCDCGFSARDCLDRCCWPRNVPRSLGSSEQLQCRFQKGAVCSPSQEPCCDPVTCGPVPAAANHTCRPSSECTLAVNCDGLSAACPRSPRLPDLTPCGGSSRVCQAGRCTGSACAATGMLPCQLRAADTDTGDDRDLLCRVGCRRHRGAPCRMQHDRRLEAGDPCDGDLGVCDALLRCRPLQGAGPLARLEALLLAGGGEQGEDGAGASRWGLAALLALLLAAVCALLLRCVALHIPSSNPNKPPPRPMSETLRVPVSTFFGLSGGGDLQL